MTLSVYLCGAPVGSLERTGPSRYRFTYSEDAVQGDWTDPMARLSASLPLREGRFKPSESAPFFEGLLPEGAVRATIAGKLGISEANGFDMLAALGADCAGAVVILSEDQPLWLPPGAVSRPLSEKQLGELLRDLPRDPLGVDVDPEGVRLSLGGVQDKLILVRLPTGDFAQPLGGTPSNCLLKPEPEHFEGLAANETFCMRVAAAAGNEVAATELCEFDGIRCLYSERFDRIVDDGTTIRLHQEDMCQALGVLPTQKYEAEGGPSVAAVIALLRRQSSRRVALDVNAFVRAVLTNFVLGNSDAHGKNFSLLYDPTAGVRLAPLYDVVSTAVYDGLTPRMAMAIGGEEDPSQVDLRCWERLGADSGLGGGLPRFVQRWASEILAATEATLRDAEQKGWLHPVMEAIADVARERAGRLIEAR